MEGGRGKGGEDDASGEREDAADEFIVAACCDVAAVLREQVRMKSCVALRERDLRERIAS